MSIVGDRRNARVATEARNATTVVLAGLLGMLAVGAAQGGVAMVRDPQTPLGMTTDYLQRAPVDTYLWPGIFLLAIAGSSSLTAFGLMTRWRWQWAERVERLVGHRWPWLGALATGGILFVFELIELFLIPFHPIMHPLLLASSTAIVGLALSKPVRRSLHRPALG